MNDSAPSPLSPFGLLQSINVIKPSGPVTIVGIADAVKTYGSWAYMRINGEEGSVDARVPTANAPNERTMVQITGVVSVRASRLSKGLDVLVTGHVDGAAPVSRENAQRVVIEKPRRVLLDALLTDPTVRLEDLTVIGTERAFSDLAGRLRVKPTFARAAMTDRDAIISTAAAAAEMGAEGLIFARGGSADATEDVWDDAEFVARLTALDVPFYTAIGHSDRMHFADMYADQPFGTPTDVGAVLFGIEQRRFARIREQNENRALRKEVDRLQALAVSSPAPNPQPLHHARTTIWSPSLTPQAWALVVAAVIIAIAVSPWLRR